VYILALVLRQHINGEESNPKVVADIYIAAVVQVDEVLSGMPLLGGCTAVDAVVAEGQAIGGETVENGGVGGIEYVVVNADVLVIGRLHIGLGDNGTDAYHALAELVHGGQAGVGEGVSADFHIMTLARFIPAV